MARYKKIVELVSMAWISREDTGNLIPVLRACWEKSNSKKDLLDFMVAVDSYFPILDHAWEGLRKGETETVDRFCSAAFTKDQVASLSPDHVVPSLNSLAQRPSPTDMETAELVSCTLSQTQTFKPAITVKPHAYHGGKAIPDCVEVAVRETLEFLLFDAET